MQYREHRSDADAGAREDERALARFEREAATWRAYLQPVAHADLRVGGIMESSYDPKARVGDPGNIRSRYLSYVPGRMVSFQVVSATPVCLLELVEEGSFDAALYYALNVMYFELFE